MRRDSSGSQERVRRHLREALSNAESSEARYHLRQALQFVEGADRPSERRSEPGE